MNLPLAARAPNQATCREAVASINIRWSQASSGIQTRDKPTDIMLADLTRSSYCIILRWDGDWRNETEPKIREYLKSFMIRQYLIFEPCVWKYMI